MMTLLALPYWQETGIKLGLALAVIPTTSLILVYLFLFKMMAFMQSRLGPNDTGPYGSLQPVSYTHLTLPTKRIV